MNNKPESYPDIAKIVEEGAKALGEVLVNPIRYRSEIFTAVKVSHQEEVAGRYVHFDSRRARTRLPIETSRSYKDSTPTLEIDVTVSKSGHRFRLEGMITDKAVCQSFTVFCYLKTIPHNPSGHLAGEALSVRAPTLLEFRERLISLQLQLDEMRREQSVLLTRPNGENSFITSAPYQSQRYHQDSLSPYSPFPQSYPRPDYPTNY